MAIVGQKIFQLPAAILELITGWLPFHAVIKLGKLSGNATLWSAMTTMGGVSQILVVSSAGLGPLLSRHALAPFLHLTTLIIHSNESMALPAGMAQDLPRTLTHIETSSLSLWTQPFDSQDAKADIIYATNLGLVPLRMQEYFPSLRLFHVETAAAECWRPGVLRFFLNHLPASLTSLSLLGDNLLSPSPPASFFQLNHLPSLTNLECSDVKFETMAPNWAASALSSLSLRFSGTFLYANPEFELLTAMTSLETLRIVAKCVLTPTTEQTSWYSGPSILPLNLTDLQLHTTHSTLLANVLFNFPFMTQLRSVDLHCHPVRSGLLTLHTFPPALTSFKLDYFDVFDIQCSWPPTLTLLHLEAGLKQPMPSLTGLTQLTALKLDASSNPPLEDLPSSLTSLHLTNHLSLDRLQSIPRKLRRLKIESKLEAAEAVLYVGWQTTHISMDALVEHFKARMLPWMRPELIDLTLNVSAHEMRMEPFNSLLRGLLSFDATSFSYTDRDSDFFSSVSLYTKLLTKVILHWPPNILDRRRGGYMAKHFLTTAPLSTLHLINHDFYPSEFADLPATITDLSLHRSAGAYSFEPPAFSPTWLPLLKRFSWSGCIFPLDCFLSRLPSMELFLVEELQVGEWNMPPLPDTLESMDMTLLYAHFTNALIPRHLRSPTTSFHLSWSKEYMKTLPHTLKSLKILSTLHAGRIRPPRFIQAYYTDLALAVLPLHNAIKHSITDLDVSEAAINMTPELLKEEAPFGDALRSMKLCFWNWRLPFKDARKNITWTEFCNWLGQALPKTLNSLSLVMHNMPDATVLFAALPRSLAHFSILYQVEIDLSNLDLSSSCNSLPPYLVLLSLLPTSMPRVTSDFFDTLPKSLTSLTLRSDPIDFHTVFEKLGDEFMLISWLQEYLPAIRHYSSDVRDLVLE